MDERLKQILAKGKEHYEKLEFEEAEPYLREVAENLPDYADVQNMLGVAQFQQGKKESAQRSFERALRVNPRYTEAALNLAVVYNELGKYEEGLNLHEGLLAASRQGGQQIDPFAKGKLANMHADLARAYEEVQLFAQATEQYRQALKLCPDFADLRTRLGHTLREQNDLAGAEKEYAEAMKVNPNYMPARVYWGLARYGQGHRDEAIAIWEEVMKTDPNNRLARTSLRMAKSNAPPESAAQPAPAGGGEGKQD
jgi:tetratricopeptide (TPR) repeat protein